MTQAQHSVRFLAQGRTLSVADGTLILETAARVGLVIDTPCGGAGTCGQCRVRIVSGADDPTEADRRAFSADELRDGWRLACQNTVRRDMVIHVSSSSLFGGVHQIIQESVAGNPATLRTAVRKVYLKLTHPTPENDVPDLLRMEKKTGRFETDLALLREMPRRLRAQGFEGTAVLSDHRLIDFEEGDTTSRCFGVAFDLGTTTLVASLVDLCSGRELAVVSRVNPQVSFGDDVLSRIQHAGAGCRGLEELRRAVVDEAARMIDALCRETRVNSQHIYEVAFAGNTTMQHLLCGIDPSQLGTIPFVPAYARGLLLPAHELEIPVNFRGTAYIFPVIGGFVGGDTVAGMLAARIDVRDSPVLMIDIGTNGEIVLAHQGELLAASTAAGPAFEGARISCGMRATRGAVEKVVLDTDVHLGVIGNGAAGGICGSGLIDLTAELLRHEIISPEGALRSAEELPASLPPSLARRVRLNQKSHRVFVVTGSASDSAQGTIVLTQRDIREVQLGCGAIRAGISILLRHAGLSASDLKTVLIAGGFGSFIRRDKAQRIGLVPPEIDPQRIHYVGNVSLAGARCALLSREARAHGEDLARRTRHVELSRDSEFQAEFAEAMIFPRTVPGNEREVRTCPS